MPTLRAFRQEVAARFGPFLARTAGAGSTTNQILDGRWPIKTSQDAAQNYLDHWLFRPNAAAGDRTRQVAEYEPSTGTLFPDTPWTTDFAVGEPYELHGRLPPADIGDNLSLATPSDVHGCINAALRRCQLVVELEGTPTVLATRHALDQVGDDWLLNERDILQVGWIAASEDRNQIDPYRRHVRGRFIIDGDLAIIEHPGQTFREDDTLLIRALKPAYYHCAGANTEFGDQSGLALEDDECPVPLDYLVAAALIEAHRLFRRDIQRVPALDQEFGQAIAAFNRETVKARRSDPPRTFWEPLVAFG